MEQQLINSLIALIGKVGGPSLIRDLNRQVDENNDPAEWTPAEMEKAIRYIDWQSVNFGAAEATLVAGYLIHQFNLRPEDLRQHNPLAETHDVRGLQ